MSHTGSSITPGPTTNEEDQRKVAELQDRLQNTRSDTAAAPRRPAINDDEIESISSVEIAPGRHKYVLIKATFIPTGKEQYIVTSKQRAAYHRDAAEPMIDKLEQSGMYCDVEVTGGGRVWYDVENKKIEIFGYSYGFGLANHAISQQVIQEDARFNGYKVTWSNEGY
jgi:phosphohistidine phosphatase